MEDVAGASGITRLIVYRHFESKHALYDAVLERVSDRLAEEFVTGLQPGRIATGAVQAMLIVAREDPGFSLLWRHAAREPEFADHADLIRARVVAGAEGLLSNLPGGRKQPPSGTLPSSEDRFRRWAATTIVAFLVEAVLGWLDEGDAADDDAFVALMARSLPALVQSWAGQSWAGQPRAG